MNPLRKQTCGARCAFSGVSGDKDTYCLFYHGTGNKTKTEEEERINNRRGYVRCPFEWEITAVKYEPNQKTNLP